MNAISEDLWRNDLAMERIQTPVSILRAQAAKLGQKTRNLVEGRVDTLSREGRIYHRFGLVAPALDNYAYDLFTISHPVTMYPIRVDREAEPQGWQNPLATEAEFVEWLRSALGSKQARRVVDALISQSSDWTVAS
jgi:hypothetical protein